MYLTFIKVKLTSFFKMMCLPVCLASIFTVRRGGDGSVCKSTAGLAEYIADISPLLLQFQGI